MTVEATGGAEHRAHNNPPDGILPVLPPQIEAETIKDSILAARAAAAEKDETPLFDAGKVTLYSANVAAFCDACGAWKDLGKITTKAQAERLTDFVAGARGLAKKIDTSRKDARAIHDVRVKVIQDTFSPLLKKLDGVLDMMKAMQTDWLSREEAREAAEKAEAARVAEEAAEKARADKAAAFARNDVSGIVDAEAAEKQAEAAQKEAGRATKAQAGSATGGGRTMALRTQAYAEITNWRAVFVQFENEPEVQELLQRLADRAIRAGLTVSGANRAERKVAA